MKLTGLAAAAATVVLAVAVPAHAGAAVKAHLECTPAGGKPLKATQKAALDKDVTCLIVIDGGAVPGGAAVAVTSSVATPVGPIFGVYAGTAALDGKGYGALPFTASSDFVACAPVTFESAIVVDKKPVWKSAVSVQPSCAAAKPTTARLGCTADTDQGILTYPGTGDAVKADLGAGLTCTVSWKPDAGGDAPRWVAINVHGSDKPPELRPLATAPNSTQMIGFAQFLQPVVPACSKAFAVDAVLLRADGAVVATMKQAIKQGCAKK